MAEGGCGTKCHTYAFTQETGVHLLFQMKNQQSFFCCCRFVLNFTKVKEGLKLDEVQEAYVSMLSDASARDSKWRGLVLQTVLPESTLCVWKRSMTNGQYVMTWKEKVLLVGLPFLFGLLCFYLTDSLKRDLKLLQEGR